MVWALNWKAFGRGINQPILGCTLVFIRSGGGHVGMYIAEDKTAYHCLGGNTSDKVTIARIDKKRLYRARRPHYNVQPASVKPYILEATGAVSRNEA